MHSHSERLHLTNIIGQLYLLFIKLYGLIPLVVSASLRFLVKFDLLGSWNDNVMSVPFYH